LIDIDPFLKDAVTRDTIPDFASPGDHFSTAGGLQFDFGDNPRRLCSGHVLDFKGATLELDADRVTDDMLRTEMAPIMIGSEMGQCYEKRTAPEEAWAALSTHISVRNVKLVANYSKLAPRARALGVKQFAIAGVGIQGHDAQASGIVLSDFGAYGREAFPCWIAGADNSFDQYAIYGPRWNDLPKPSRYGGWSDAQRERNVLLGLLSELWHSHPAILLRAGL
jgi:hypothetical protein